MPAKRLASVTVTPGNGQVYPSTAGKGVFGTAKITNNSDGYVACSVYITDAAAATVSEVIEPYLVLSEYASVELTGLAFGDGQRLAVVPGHASLIVNLMGTED